MATQSPTPPAVAEFNAAVEQEVRAGTTDRREAVAKVCMAKPDLHRRYLEQVNLAAGRAQAAGDIACRFSS